MMGRPARAADLKVKQELLVVARTGAGFRVSAGEFVQVVDVSGQQCADFFAFDAEDPRELLSASHPRVAVDRLFPQVNQSFFSSLRRPMLQFEEDHSPGVHDMLFAACDPARYAQYGVDGRSEFAPTPTGPGDYVLLKAFHDCLVVISACPQEWNPAANYHPSDLLA